MSCVQQRPFRRCRYDRNVFAVFDGKTHPFYKHVPACTMCMYLHMAVDL